MPLRHISFLNNFGISRMDIILKKCSNLKSCIHNQVINKYKNLSNYEFLSSYLQRIFLSMEALLAEKNAPYL